MLEQLVSVFLLKEDLQLVTSFCSHLGEEGLFRNCHFGFLFASSLLNI